MGRSSFKRLKIRFTDGKEPAKSGSALGTKDLGCSNLQLSKQITKHMGVNICRSAIDGKQEANSGHVQR